MDRVKEHQNCIDIVDAIRHYLKRRININQNINGFGGQFPFLLQKYEHELMIIDMCINRLEERYNKVLNKISHKNEIINQ